MNPRIERDVRLVLPPWLLAIVLVTVAALLPRSFGQGWIITVVVFAWPIIAASIFGGEFAHGTISQLLSQPMERRRIWKEKMIVLGTALASLFVAVLVLESEHFDKSATLFLAVVPFCAFCTLPFYTLVGRSTISAVILAIPIPGIIFVVGASVILWLFHIGALDSTDPYSPINENRLHWWVRGYFGIVLPVYCALIYFLGYRRFLNFEVVGQSERQIRLPGSMQNGLERVARYLVPARMRHLRALVAKELHLQHNATILFVIFAVLQTLAIVYIMLAHPKDPEPYFIVPLGIYAALMPLVIGSSAIAEETNLGIRGWHLTLPYSARAQWFIKVAIVLAITALLGIGVPLLWNFIGNTYIQTSLYVDNEFGWPSRIEVFGFACGSLLLALTAFYASSFSRDTLRALLTTFSLCAGMVFTISLISAAIERSSLITGELLLPVVQQFGAPGLLRSLKSEWLILGLPVLCLAFLLLRSSLKHFKTLDHGRIWSSILLVFFPPICVLFFLVSIGLAASKLR